MSDSALINPATCGYEVWFVGDNDGLAGWSHQLQRLVLIQLPDWAASLSDDNAAKPVLGEPISFDCDVQPANAEARAVIEDPDEEAREKMWRRLDVAGL